MKKQMNLWKTMLALPWLLTGAAHAESVTVNVAAVVSEVNDPSGGIVDTIPLGTIISGTYTYETTTPDQDPHQQVGLYPHEGETGHLNLTVGPYQVDSDTSQPSFVMNIDDEAYASAESYIVSSMPLLPSNGVTFDYAAIELNTADAYGLVLDSADLTATPPDFTRFAQSRVRIDGMNNGEFFQVFADLTGLSVSGHTVPPQTRYEYRANAVVTYVDDPAGMLGGRLLPNDMITTGFVYDMSTPDSGTYPDQGIYLHEPGAGALSVAFADVAMESDPAAQTPIFYVGDSVDPLSPDYMHFYSYHVGSSDPALTVNEIGVYFDGAETVLSTTKLPADTLSLPDWQSARVQVIGDGWVFEAVFTDLELLQASTLSVFPADGLVHPLQHFDMSLRVNGYPAVVGLQGMNNGQDISTYLAGCAILPKLDTTQSVVCPDTTMLLGPGANALQFQLMLDGGDMLDATVDWEVRD